MPAARKARLAMLGAAAIAVLLLAFAARGALIPFILGAALAYLLAPLVDLLAVVMPFSNRERARGAAILSIYGAVGATLTVLGIIFVPVIADQLTQLGDDLPALIDDGQRRFERFEEWYEENIPADVRDRIQSGSDDLEERASDLAGDLADSAVDFVFATASVILGYLVIPVWLFYVLKDRGQGMESFFNFLPDEIREDARNIVAIVNRTIGNYIRAQVFLGIVVGTVTAIGLYILDVPFAVGLGVIAGVTELIPIIGPIIGSIPALIVALAVDPSKAIWVGVLYLAVQQLENNLLVPRVQGWAIHMNPAIIIVLLVLANALVGFWGMLVVIPFAAIVKEVFLYIYRRLEEMEGEPPADEEIAEESDVPLLRSSR